MADAFISYAKKDKQFASTLADALTTSGCTVWWDRDIEHGKYFDRVIEREIQSATVVIVVWSIAGRESDWCRAEAAAALEQSKLLPISIQQARPPMRFMHLHTGDLSDWEGDTSAEAFQLLCRDLRGYGIKFDNMPTQSISVGKSDVLSKPHMVLPRFIVGLAGLAALFVAATIVVPAALRIFNIPNCLTYPDAYRNAWHVFKREGQFWREYPLDGGPAMFEFKEAGRTREFIELLNLTERPQYKGLEKTMIVRLPVCGGAAKVSMGITQDNWESLPEVCPIRVNRNILDVCTPPDPL